MLNFLNLFDQFLENKQKATAEFCRLIATQRKRRTWGYVSRFSIIFLCGFIIFSLLMAGNGYPKYGGIGGQGGCIAFEAQEELTLNGLAKK